MELTEEYAKHILGFVARHFGYDKLDIVNNSRTNKMLMSSEYMMMMSKKTEYGYVEDQLVVVSCSNMNGYSLSCCVKRSYAQCLLELIERHAHVVPLSKMINLDVPSFNFPETLEEMCILSDINSAS